MASINVTFKTTGLLNPQVNGQMQIAVNKATSIQLIDEAEATEEQAKRSILKGPKTGKKYRIPNSNVTYRASAPGQAPANRTSKLNDRIQADRQIRREAASILYSRVISGAKYSSFLEFGTSRMKARPFLGPAAEDNRHGKAKDRGKRVLTAITNAIVKYRNRGS